jgi:ribonuclease inhibitor
VLYRIQGERVRDEREFHEEIARLLDLGPHYGKNLDALWDRLSADVERPVMLVWSNAAMSQEHMGSAFDAVVAVLRRVESQDAEENLVQRFTLQLC